MAILRFAQNDIDGAISCHAERQRIISCQEFVGRVIHRALGGGQESCQRAEYLAGQQEGAVKMQLEDYLEAVFLDIETTGINPAFSELTLIALYQQDVERKARLYVNDLHGAAETLKPLETKAQEYGYDSLIVCSLEHFAQHAPFLSQVATYNGEQFDLPFIAYHLPSLRAIFRKWHHLDIYVHVAQPLRDIGLLRTPNLQLKTLFTHLRVPRHPSIDHMRGGDAVRLWNRWKHLYDSEALTTLSVYALEDVRGTRLLLERLIDVRRGSPFDSLP